jgi:pimeloyl-ACP methyl ester carboxylesterase
MMSLKVYKSENAKQHIYETYDKLVALWGVETQEKDVDTFYGTTHIIECGEISNPPLVLFHGVGDDSALMWIYNASKLAEHFKIYAIDTIGGPGKSCPNEHYDKSFDEIKWMDEVFHKLKLEKFYLVGVSNGSYMAQHYGIMRPDKTLKIICMAGAVADESSKSPIIRMLRVFLPEALFPTRKNAEKLIKKMTGSNYKVFTENPALMEHFRWLLKGFNNMAMTNHKIVFFNEEQISRIRGIVLFLRGESDPLGDAQTGREKLERYHLDYRYFPNVGHAINQEIADEINDIIISSCIGDKIRA